jgi:hypothetical protein
VGNPILSRRHLSLLVKAVCLGCLAAAPSAHAVTIAADFTGGTDYERGTFQNFGWYFDVTTPVDVTALGLFDTGSDGLTDDHPVGIWDAAGDLLATTTITNADPLTPATASSLGGWRFAAITPVMLDPGSYTIGAYYPTAADFFVGNAISPTTADGITYVSGGVTPGMIQGFHDLTGTDAGGDPGFFGPNFLIAEPESLIPEPGSLGLLASGLLVMAGVAFTRVRR